MMNNVIERTMVGRGYSIVGCNNVDDVPPHTYSVALMKGDRRICILSGRCIGIKAMHYWMDYHTKIMTRLIFLFDGVDMAAHNMNCYSGRDEYRQQYEECKSQYDMLMIWIKEIVDGIAKEDARMATVNEFYDIYINN